MKLQITILDMAYPMSPEMVLLWVPPINSLEYPVSYLFPLPATSDASVKHQYMIVVEDLDRQ